MMRTRSWTEVTAGTGLSRRSLLAGILAGSAVRVSSSRAGTVSKPNGLSIQRLAWAGIKLEAGGVAVFIDASAPDPASGAAGPALASSAARSFALVTHHHGDHCDPLALKPVLGSNGYMVAHEDVSKLFDHQGVTVQTVCLSEPVFLSRSGGEFVAGWVPAVDGLGSPQVSWIVDGGGRRIIHCGDTLWHGRWWDFVRAYGPFAAAFLPINGMRQQVGRYTDVTQPMSLTPEQAVSAARILKPRTVIPIHYGSQNEPGYLEESDAEGRFLRGVTAAQLACKVLKPGDTVAL